MAQAVLVLLGDLLRLAFLDVLKVEGIQLYASIYTATSDQLLVELLDFHAHKDL